jgi:hypothetical protein
VVAPDFTTAPERVFRPSGSLRDQGVLGLQLCQRGDTAEVRLRLRQGGGVVEASLRETGRGVEIQLTAGPEHQLLLARVAEALARQSGDQSFELDSVSVDTQGNPPDHRRQTLGDDPVIVGPPRHRSRRAAGQPLATPIPAAAVSTHYLR